MSEKKAWRIVAPHFVAALIVYEGRVVDSAPILAWARNKTWREVRGYLKARGWHGRRLRYENLTAPPR